jgi:hypothetical protein
VVVELHRIGAPVVAEGADRRRQPGAGRELGDAVEHRHDAAELAAVAAADRRLVHRGAAAHEARPQIAADVPGLLVRQRREGVRGPEVAIGVVPDVPLVFPGEPGDPGDHRGIAGRGDRRRRRPGVRQAVEELAERVLALAADHVVDVRGVDRGVRVEGGEVAAPDDRHLGMGGADRGRELDRRADLRTGHDAHPHRGDGSRVALPEEGEGLLLHPRIDVAVEDLVVAGLVEHRAQGEEGERQPQRALRAHAGVDQQDPRTAHVASSG